MQFASAQEVLQYTQYLHNDISSCVHQEQTLSTVQKSSMRTETVNSMHLCNAQRGLTSSFAESPTIIACSGGMPQCWQICSKAPGLGLYGLNSRLNAGQKGLSEKWLS